MFNHTLTKTRIRTRTKVALIALALSGIALAGVLINQQDSATQTTGTSVRPWTCSETDTLANFQVKGLTSLVNSSTAEKKALEDYCVPVRKPDLFLQNSADGSAAVWIMNGTTVKEGRNLGVTPGASWKMINAGDFNSDGANDILLQNSTDGSAAVWIMDGTTVKEGRNLGVTPGASWKIINYADLNSDGNNDIFLQNSTDGSVAVWIMNGTTLKEGRNLGITPGAAWKLIGASDLNDDKKPDFFLQNSTDGRVAVWIMDGTTLKEGRNLGITPGAAWKLIGVNDLNADKKPDFFLQNSTDGRVAVWIMDGTTLKEGRNLGVTPGAAWKLIGVNDLNDDLKPDFFLQNSTDGSAAVWIMDGTTVKEGRNLGVTPGAAWKLIGANDLKSDGKPSLMEYYCDNLSATGYSTRQYKCDTCDSGQCAQMRCLTDLGCNDLYLYTLGACQSNICSFKKIEKYYDLTLQRTVEENDYSLYEGSVQNLSGSENLDEFFAKQDDGFVAQFTSSDGSQKDVYQFDLMAEYSKGYRFEGESGKEVLKEDEFIKLRLPYGEEGYKSIEIFTPNKELSITKIDLSGLPLTVAKAEVVQELAVAREEKSQSEKVLGAFDVNQTFCGKTYSKNIQTIPDTVKINVGTSAHSPEGLKSLIAGATENFDKIYPQQWPKSIKLIAKSEMASLCGKAKYIGCYDTKTNEIIIDDTLNEFVMKSVIAHEMAHRIWFFSTISNGSVTGLAEAALITVVGKRELANFISKHTDTFAVDRYNRKWIDLLAGSPYYGSSEYKGIEFSKGFIYDYGATSFEEDVATFAEAMAQDPSKFVNYLYDGKIGTESDYYAKLKLLYDMHILSQAQIDTFAMCYADCFGSSVLDIGSGSDIFDAGGDYLTNDDPFVKGEGDSCSTTVTNELQESYCDAGTKKIKPVNCPFGCDSAKSICNSCMTKNDGEIVAFYRDKNYGYWITNGTIPWDEKLTHQCADSKNLITRSCDNSQSFPQPLQPSKPCLDKCAVDQADGIEKCIDCPVQDCKTGVNIGRIRSTTTAGAYEKCEDTDGDGCGAWRRYACSVADCHGDKIGTTRCGSESGATIYQKCVDPDGDRCGYWTSNPCTSGTFCMPGKTQCGNYCDPINETDGGVNFNKPGYLYNLLGVKSTDVCSSSTLREYSCTNGVVFPQDHVCTSAEGYCNWGGCGRVCDPLKETDKGANFEVKGYVVDYYSSTTHFDDTCIDGNILKETVCNADKRLEYQTHACGTGNACLNDACVKAGPACGTTTCVFGDICVSSKCVTPYKCYDTDGGGAGENKRFGYIYYYDSSGKISTSGIVGGGSCTETTNTDHCHLGDYLHERYCLNPATIDKVFEFGVDYGVYETRCDCSQSGDVCY